jgi:hypothetical protein
LWWWLWLLLFAVAVAVVRVVAGVGYVLWLKFE